MTVLLVLFTVIIFLGIDQGLQYVQRRRLAVSPGSVRIPSGLDLAVNHTWMRGRAHGTTTIGLDEFIGTLIGVPEYIALPGAGTRVMPSSPSVSLRQGGRQLQFALPIAGRVVGVNSAVLKNPSLAVADPYGKGWLMKVQPFDRASAGVVLVDRERVAEWMRGQFAMAKDFFAGRTPQPALMQDGGVPVEGTLRGYDAETWKAFEQKFLSAQIIR